MVPMVPWYTYHTTPGPIYPPSSAPLWRRTSRRCTQRNNNNNNPRAYGSQKVPYFILGAPPPRIKHGTFLLPTPAGYYYYCSAGHIFLAVITPSRVQEPSDSSSEAAAVRR